MPRPRRVLWGITPRKKLDYARLIDAAEDGEELGFLGDVRALSGDIYLLVGCIAFDEKHRVCGQHFTRNGQRLLEWTNQDS